MSGVKFLLDTNILIGMYKGALEVKALLQAHNVTLVTAGYSAVTRMELLSYPNITDAEIKSLQNLLDKLDHFPLTREIEERTILLRRKHRLKLPDAIIVATAKVHGLQLLTLDKNLLSIL